MQDSSSEFRSAILEKPHKIAIRRVDPAALGPEDALVEIAFAGVCGTDLAIWSGKYSVPLPLVPGHEYSGRVVRLGGKAPKRLLGKRVTGEINFTCVAKNEKKLCPMCKAGLVSHCSKRTVLGIAGANGAFSTHLVAPWRTLHELPTFLTMEEATLIEPLAAAIETFKLTPSAENVVVLGAGRLGRLVILYAAACGMKVIVAEKSAERRKLAKRLGAHFVLDPTGGTNKSGSNASRANRSGSIASGESTGNASFGGLEEGRLRAKILSITGGLGADMVVECAGDEKALNDALALVRPRGTIAIKSTTGLKVNGLETTKAVVDEISIIGTRCGPFDEAISFIKAKRPPLAGLIDMVFPLEDTDKALHMAGRLNKVLISPRGQNS
jgi:2-desacetyl-2-hydroxyethyl bacteriochlorophyllide A dehydrogenase